MDSVQGIMGLEIKPDTFIAPVRTREEEEEEDLSSDGVSLKGSKEAMAKTDDQDLEMERERGSQRQHHTAKAWQLLGTQEAVSSWRERAG